MKMVLAMLLIFFVTGAVTERITRWTVAGMLLAIVAVLTLTRLTF
jgi:hypothetical protein